MRSGAREFGIELLVLMNWYLVRERVTLFGPSARELIPAVTQDEFVASVRVHYEAAGVDRGVGSIRFPRLRRADDV